MPDETKKLQSLLDSQVGKGGLRNIVAAVQSYDKSLDFVGTAGVADPATGAPMRPETRKGCLLPWTPSNKHLIPLNSSSPVRR